MFRIALVRWEVGITAHAVERMREMAVTLDEVEQAVKHWENRYACGPTYPPRSEIRQAGRLAVVIRETARGPILVTVLWRTQETYVRKGK